jgi:hypothetical protein
MGWDMYTLEPPSDPAYVSTLLAHVTDKTRCHMGWDMYTLEPPSDPAYVCVCPVCRLAAGAAEGSISSSSEPYMMTMSTLTEEGVMAVKQTACDRLLNFRVDMKLAGKRVTDVLNRMHVAVPKPRDRQTRPPVIPPSVAAARAAAGAAAAAAAAAKRKTEKDLQEEHGGAGGCIDMGSPTRGCLGASSKQWELGSLSVVRDVHNSKLCVWWWG